MKMRKKAPPPPQSEEMKNKLFDNNGPDKAQPNPYQAYRTYIKLAITAQVPTFVSPLEMLTIDPGRPSSLMVRDTAWIFVFRAFVMKCKKR